MIRVSPMTETVFIILNCQPPYVESKGLAPLNMRYLMFMPAEMNISKVPSTMNLK